MREEIQQNLAPYLEKLIRPEPLVFTVAEACLVLRTGEDTIRRWVKTGRLARVPAVGRVLIPRWSVEAFVRPKI